jgi:nitric oxide reductase activation protein
LAKVRSASSSGEVAVLCLQMLDLIGPYLKYDMSSEYFATTAVNGIGEVLTPEWIDEEKRHKKMKNDEQAVVEDVPEDKQHEEELPSWHQESEEQTENFLKFELEQGVRTDRWGHSLRETDPGDQAMGVTQGSAQFSKGNDFSQEDGLAERLDSIRDGQQSGYRGINLKAFPVYVPVRTPTIEEKISYMEMRNAIAPYKKKLITSMRLILEHQQTANRADLPFGRLGKKLTRVLTDKNPRLFHKKVNPTQRIDASFLLLVDCSASMFDKMSQTQLAITLFHEVLRSFQISHQVVGFWEDSEEGSSRGYPNSFQIVIDFPSSLAQTESGPKLLQLAPQQDNRDGYAIRLMTQRLLQCSTKQRFLLVFTDGEPAASAYDEDGILDTYQSVIEARRSGIEVVGVFLANGEITERQRKTIENIYGRHSVLVPRVEELSALLLPILRKLLRKAI